MYRSKISYFLVFSILILSLGRTFGQNPCDYTGDTDNRRANWQYYKAYSGDQKKIIFEHWKEYFQGDIHQQLAPSIDMFPIKFDSYGSLYPNSDLFKEFDSVDFNPDNLKAIKANKNSMLNIFIGSKDKLRPAINKLTDKKERDFYTTALNESKSLDDDSLFYFKWDKFHDGRIQDSLNKKIAAKEKAGKKVRVVFFIHGYNVPYSLANIQAIELIKILARNNIDTSSIVLVPVFWPSHDGKNRSIQDSVNFCTDNNTKLLNGGLENGLGFLFYSNQAYFAGIGLRKLINSVAEKSPHADILVFSHSLGATAATTAFINTYSKLDTRFVREKNQAKNAEDFLKACKTRMRKKEPENYAILTEMVKVHLPAKKVKIFMSAAAIPGYNTFYDRPSSCESNCSFYVAIDTCDEMLNKDILPLNIGNPYYFGVTSLGLNYGNDAENVRTEFFTHHPENFNFEKVSSNVDHDILTYMRQSGYVNYIINFFKE